GIRGRNATGVQTCALPICVIWADALPGLHLTIQVQQARHVRLASEQPIPHEEQVVVLLPRCGGEEELFAEAVYHFRSGAGCEPRSEERRVGRECRGGLEM